MMPRGAQYEKEIFFNCKQSILKDLKYSLIMMQSHNNAKCYLWLHEILGIYLLFD